MKRRDFMRNAAMTAAGITISSGQKAGAGSAQKQAAASNKIHYEVHGNPKGKPLFLGFPIMASYGDIFGKDNAKVLSGFLDRLTDRYRVLVVDYPNIGKSHTPPAAEMTANRVCADLLSVVSEAGFDRFAYWGYSWGGGGSEYCSRRAATACPRSSAAAGLRSAGSTRWRCAPPA